MKSKQRSSLVLIKEFLLLGKTYTSHLKEGQRYEDLPPVISINLLDFKLCPELEQVHSCFRLTEQNNPGIVFSNDMIIHCLEVPKLDKFSQGLKDSLNQWLSWLQMEGKISENDINQIIKEDDILKEAHDKYMGTSKKPLEVPSDARMHPGAVSIFPGVGQNNGFGSQARRKISLKA